MKTKLFTVVSVMMLAVFAMGIASAGTNGNGNANRGGEIIPLSSAVDAQSSQVIWNAGTLGYLHINDIASTLERWTTMANITVFSGSSTYYETPFSLPARINNKPTSVRYVYLQWQGPPAMNITEMWAYSGASDIGTNPHPVGREGTGLVETVTVDLDAWYPVSKGLGIGWTFANSDASDEKEYSIYGYGAKIRYST